MTKKVSSHVFNAGSMLPVQIGVADQTESTEAVTRAFFYTMLETGISLVAVNLPSLWLLFTSVTPEKVIRSIRSVLSLASLRSGGSGGDSTHEPKKPYGNRGSTADIRPSVSSTARFHPKSPEDLEAQDAQASAIPGGLTGPDDVHMSHLHHVGSRTAA